MAPATQRAHHTHMPSNAPLNSVTTRPSFHESHYYHHTHALPSPEDPDAIKFNPTGPSGAFRAYTSFIFLCTGRLPGQPGLPRPPEPQDRDPTSSTQRYRSGDTPTARLAHRPYTNLPNRRTSQANPSPLPKSTPYRPRLTRHLLNLH